MTQQLREQAAVVTLLLFGRLQKKLDGQICKKLVGIPGDFSVGRDDRSHVVEANALIKQDIVQHQELSGDGVI